MRLGHVHDLPCSYSTARSDHDFGSPQATAVATQSDQLAIGQDDGTISLLDIRMGTFTHQGTGKGSVNGQPHESEVKSLQYAPTGQHKDMLLSCSYDGSVAISQPSPAGEVLHSTKVAWHNDKVITARWCPVDTGEEFPGFVTASADKTVRLWAPAGQ